MERILVYGQGGHSKVIQMMIDGNKNQTVQLIADDDDQKVDETKAIKVIQAQRMENYQSEFDSAVIAIGTNAIRKKLLKTKKVRTLPQLLILQLE